VDDYLQVSYDDVIFASNPTQLLYRLDAIGDLSYDIIQRLKIKRGNDNQLKNYFDKYFEVANNRVLLKKILVVNPFVHREIGNIIGALQDYSSKKASRVVDVRSHYERPVHKPNEEIPASNINLLLRELHRIDARISTIEQKVESMNKTIEYQFASLTPFEKHLSKLETLYSSIQGLDKRILLQEESLRSMVEKHMQIAMYSQELSQTSKDVYELMKLFLLESIMTKTK
jgi:hypothetical protein